MVEHLADASSQCPLCGNDTPHGHDERDIITWLDAQASRFGVKAVYRRRSANDEISVLGDLRQRAETYYKSQGYDDDDIELAIVEIEALERQITALTAQLANCREATAGAFARGESHVWLQAAQIIEAQDGMQGWKRRLAMLFRSNADGANVRALTTGERSAPVR